MKAIYSRLIKRLLATFFILSFVLWFYTQYILYRCSKNPNTYPLINYTYIPKKIYMTAKQSSDVFSGIIESWSQNNPDYTYELFDDLQADNFVKQHMGPDIYKTYSSLPLPVLKADYFRYIILYVNGGIYTDIDTICRRPINTWTDGDDTIKLILGVEVDMDKYSDWKSMEYARNFQILQWTIASAPNHPILKDIIYQIHDSVQFKTLDKTMVKGNILDLTGPGVWTDVILKHLNTKYNVTHEKLTGIKYGKRIGDIYILPRISFSPFDGEERDPEVKVQHLFWGSWKNSTYSKLFVKTHRYLNLLYRC